MEQSPRNTADKIPPNLPSFFYSPPFLRTQAAMTAHTRQFFYQRTGFAQVPWALDLGCGIGLITREMVDHTLGHVIGLDLNITYLEEARKSHRAKDLGIVEKEK